MKIRRATFFNRVIDFLKFYVKEGGYEIFSEVELASLFFDNGVPVNDLSSLCLEGAFPKKVDVHYRIKHNNDLEKRVRVDNKCFYFYVKI